MTEKKFKRLRRHTLLFFASLGFVFGTLRTVEGFALWMRGDWGGFTSMVFHIILTGVDYSLIWMVFWMNDQDKRIEALEKKHE